MVSAVITSEPLQGPHDVVPDEDDVNGNLCFDSQGNVLRNFCLGLPLGSPPSVDKLGNRIAAVPRRNVTAKTQRDR